jgi:UDP-N-acetylmuramoylalanine-D-glutamate ligase
MNQKKTWIDDSRAVEAGLTILALLCWALVWWLAGGVG